MNKPSRNGLMSLGNGSYAWLAPYGTWGWSNAGLIVDADESLLVDTLYDLRLTREMLDAMTRAEPVAAKSFDTLVNTHANGDHCHGNQLVHGAEIIASKASAAEMQDLPPEAMAALMSAAAEMGPLGQYFKHCFGSFRFDNIQHTPPTKTFERELKVKVGDKTVQLLEVGPAHTKGDVLAYCEADKAVFTGDILFIDGTPIMWEGPVANWLKACDLIQAMDVETIVPGHGPITDKAGVSKVKSYLEFVRDQAKIRYDSGMGAFEAAQDIELCEYSSWSDPERIAVNVDSLYREFNNDKVITDVSELFDRMAHLAGFYA